MQKHLGVADFDSEIRYLKDDPNSGKSVSFTRSVAPMSVSLKILQMNPWNATFYGRVSLHMSGSVKKIYSAGDFP